MIEDPLLESNPVTYPVFTLHVKNLWSLVNQYCIVASCATFYKCILSYEI